MADSAMDTSPFIRRVILDLLNRRSVSSSICPSEAARAAFPDNWRPYMISIRKVAREMQAEGLIEVTQKGSPVVLDESIRGPIRLRKPGG
ncbi:MAG: DUF3253 domain-containing protein [Verrucomicrobiota bacterium]